MENREAGYWKTRTFSFLLADFRASLMGTIWLPIALMAVVFVYKKTITLPTAMGILCIAGALFFIGWWRAKNLRLAYESGIAVPGRILSVSLGKKYKKVSYEYEYQGRTVRKWFITGFRTERLEGFFPGRNVTIIVSHQDPERTFLEELFT